MRILAPLLALAALTPSLSAQTMCGSTPLFATCEIAFELTGPDATAHPHPYRDVDLRIEFRSPRNRTFAIPAFWDGGQTLRIRFTPNETGSWSAHITSNVAAWNDKELRLTVTDSPAPGFVEAANVHHFANTGPFAYNSLKTPHLWMGQVIPDLNAYSPDQFAQLAATRARQHFNHFRVTLLDATLAKSFQDPWTFDVTPFREIDAKLAAANKAGIAIDLAIAGPGDLFTKTFPEHGQRERFVRYVVARYAGLNMTWQGLDRFETYGNARELLQEIAGYLNTLDSYRHPQSTGAEITSAPLFDDKWMKYITYRAPDPQVGAIEHQIYPGPQVNDFAAGAQDAAAFRKRLWNTWMSGQYPEATLPGEEAANQMKVWAEFASTTRYWDMEPFFDVDGGRGLCLPTVDYVIYIEKPGPVDVHLDQKRKWDAAWINPLDGERIPVKDFKSNDEFQGSPPDSSHDWLLEISREGHKAGMKSYKFESWEIVMQEVEGNPEKVPFDIDQPTADTLSLTVQAPFKVKVKKETKATKKMMYLWTGEVTADGQGYRVIATGPDGIFNIPPAIAQRFPAGLHVRLLGLNGYGKLYVAEKNYQLNR